MDIICAGLHSYMDRRRRFILPDTLFKVLFLDHLLLTVDALDH